MTALVRYRVGTYSGDIVVTSVDPGEETETVIARARKILERRSGGPLPLGAESWREIERTEEE